jgi:hypothetical protein
MSTSGEKLRKYPDLTTWSFEAVDEQRYYNTQRYSGGDRHIASYLASLDLSEFDPKAPPPKTQAFWEIVDASRAPEDAEMADAIERLGSPNALTLAQIITYAEADFAIWLRDRKNATHTAPPRSLRVRRRPQ